MPGINLKKVKRLVPMSRVLELLEFETVARCGDQLRGPCPIHGSRPGSRSLSVNLIEDAYYCHSCGSNGNQLDLWAGTRQLTVYDAAQDLCEAAGCDIPWITTW